jgi:uncharacterized protein YndB with AHSA1/START domain
MSAVLRNQWLWAFVVFLGATLTAQFINHAPAQYRVVRTTTINAPPSVVFAQIADFGQWPLWSPWAKMDANAKNTVSGQPRSVGHVMAWDGEIAGTGTQTIVAIEPNLRLRTQLNFTAPFSATPTSEFVLTAAPGGKQTVIEWDLRDSNALLTRIVMTVLFVNMEATLGEEYEAGLRDLKALCEKQQH